jgi:DNA-binding transcriptional ArsR family regulator
METSMHVRVFGALAHPQRLAVFQLLARTGDQGLAAGELARRLELPPSTLSFHLRDLEAAGLVRARREGRSIAYAVRGDTLRATLWFLGEDCCQGRVDLCPDPTARIRSHQQPAEPGARPGVLFVCTQNAARSQLAEALLRASAHERFRVTSAGLQPASVHPLVAVVLEELGSPPTACTARTSARCSASSRSTTPSCCARRPRSKRPAGPRSRRTSSCGRSPTPPPCAARRSSSWRRSAAPATRSPPASSRWLHDLDHPPTRTSRSPTTSRKKIA